MNHALLFVYTLHVVFQFRFFSHSPVPLTSLIIWVDGVSASSHDRILVDFCSGGEDMPADMGQTDGGHNTNQQLVHEPQAKHPRP